MWIFVWMYSYRENRGSQDEEFVDPPKVSCFFMVPCRGMPASVAQLDAPSDWRPGGRGFNPRRGRQHSFMEIDHEIFCRSFSPFG